MRIATYNTRGSLGSDGLRSTKRIAETLRPFSADVICFQEIYQRIPPPLEDQPAKLEALLNRSFVFQRCLDFAFGGVGEWNPRIHKRRGPGAHSSERQRAARRSGGAAARHWATQRRHHILHALGARRR